MFRIIILSLFFFISFNLNAKENNLSCDCLDFEYQNAGDKFFTAVGCNGVNHWLSEAFTATIHYKNNDIISHATSSLTYSVEGIIHAEYNHEVTFDFVWHYFWEKREKWSYVFYRLTINKYNLDYQITSYNRDLTDEVKAYSLDKNSPNYYLIDLFKDREKKTISKVKGSCNLAKKKI